MLSKKKKKKKKTKKKKTECKTELVLEQSKIKQSSQNFGKYKVNNVQFIQHIFK